VSGVDPELGEEAAEYGRVVRAALEAAGGDRLVADAEADPGTRRRMADVLAGLGAWELDPRASAEEAEAAAVLCRAAGWWGVPYPVAERLARPSGGGADGLVVVDLAAPAARLDGLTDLAWTAVTLDGTLYGATPRPADQPPRRSAFVVDLDLVDLDRAEVPGGADLALALVLPCWTLLGMLDRAIALTCAHVGEREQFGVAIGTFQGVQFQLTEAEVERAGVEALAGYALWSTTATPDDAVADALALRLAALEAAEVVFRVTHQLHGAVGFCDETTLSWLSRHSQPLRRLPLGPTATGEALTRHVGRRGLTGLFDDLANPAATPAATS
jgi:hypothetical protein